MGLAKSSYNGKGGDQDDLTSGRMDAMMCVRDSVRETKGLTMNRR